MATLAAASPFRAGGGPRGPATEFAAELAMLTFRALPPPRAQTPTGGPSLEELLAAVPDAAAWVLVLEAFGAALPSPAGGLLLPTGMLSRLWFSMKLQYIVGQGFANVLRNRALVEYAEDKLTPAVEYDTVVHWMPPNKEWYNSAHLERKTAS